MRIGIPEYEITYLGEPVSVEVSENVSNRSYVDFNLWISDIITYNIDNGFTTSLIDVSEFEFICDVFSDYLAIDEIILSNALLGKIKDKILDSSHKIYFYVPKEYFLGSLQTDVITNTILGLNNLNEILKFLDVQGGIIVRVGSAYGNRKETMIRFAQNYKKLNETLKYNLMLVNDDRPSLFSVKDLLTELSIPYKIPIVFRTIGHYFNPGSLTHSDALSLSLSTWPKDKFPLIIHAESINFKQSGIPESRIVSNYLTKRIPTFNKSFCVAIESNYKELSCYRYINEYKILKPVIIDKIK